MCPRGSSGRWRESQVRGGNAGDTEHSIGTWEYLRLQREVWQGSGRPGDRARSFEWNSGDTWEVAEPHLGGQGRESGPGPVRLRPRRLCR